MAVVELTRGIDQRVVLVDSTGTPISGSNPSTVDTELPAAAALSDGIANPTTPLIGACNMLNASGGTTWTRWLAVSALGDASIGGQTGSVGLMGYNATLDRYARVRVDPTSSDLTTRSGGFDLALPTCTFTRGANTTPYTIGDEVGTSGTAPTTAVFGRANGYGGVIQGCRGILSNSPVVTPSLRVLLFSATVTLAGDNAQLALSDGDALLYLGSILLTESQSLVYSAGAATTTAALGLAGVPTAPIKYKCGASETTLYVAVMTLNAWTPIANSETLQLLFTHEAN